MEHVVGIGGYAVSANPSDVIKTFALSTCVGLVYYSPRRQALGMIHIQLPNSRAAHAGDEPSRFADVGPAFLLGHMSKLGCTKGELQVLMYGGIDGRGEKDCFRVGEKNREISKNALKGLGMAFKEVDVGGCFSRTLVATVGNGNVEVIKRPMQIGGIAVEPAASSGGFKASAAAPGMRNAKPASGFIGSASSLAVSGASSNVFGQRPAQQTRSPMGITLRAPAAPAAPPGRTGAASTYVPGMYSNLYKK